MIAHLHGKLAFKQPPTLVMDVNGVGYEVEAPMSTFLQLPDVGEELTLITHMIVREDAQLLYGFVSEAERRLFRSLLKVSGVGARLALTILSGINVEGFVRCVQHEDSAALVRLPGVGKKTADRLIVEMRDRIERDAVVSAGPGGVVVDSPNQDAFNALLALGYKPGEVSRMLKRVDPAGLSTEDILRQVLQKAAAV